MPTDRPGRRRRPSDAPDAQVDADEIARLIDRLQDVAIPEPTWAATHADLLRINDNVRAVAEAKLDFFDAPSAFHRLMREDT